MRATRNEAWSYFQHILTAAAVAVKGEVACLDTATGLIVVAAVGPGLKPVGYFDEDLTGDGTAPVRVRLFKEIRVHWFDNDDGGTPVVAADIGGTAYFAGAALVTSASAGASEAGTIWGVNSLNGVAVEMVGF